MKNLLYFSHRYFKIYADCYYEKEKGMILKSKMNIEEIVSNTARVTD
jgi:hypothetical protein